MARATKAEQTGSIGVSEATGKFARIGFGFAEITRHDNGTDVFLMARDARLFDLGLTLGAQIKGGPSWFKEPEEDDEGHTLGWWFRDSDGSHIDDWLRHGLPHLLVMHNLDDDITYWVHVTDDAVISTGKGKKILVPANQRVDEDSRDALIAIAASTRPAPRWEGSAWRGAESVLERDLLRYALLVPRLVAPHANAPKDVILTPAQAIAMVLQARLSDLEEYERLKLLPPTVQAANEQDWTWQFYAALHHRITTGNVDQLIQLGKPPTPETAVAAAVTAAASVMEEDRYQEAADILQRTIDDDAAEPVDHAWLCVQLSRALAQLGRLEEARKLAASVQDVAATHSVDVTATAIAGAGAQLLFSLAWSVGDLNNGGQVGKAIEAADTAANWWRQLTRSWALTDSLERSFRSWTGVRQLRWSSTDTATNQLVAGSFNAALVGAHSDWRQLTGLLGKDQMIRLDRNSTSEDASSAVTLLRLSGQVSATQQAAQRILKDGPASALADAAKTIELDGLSRTSAQSSLALLRVAGAILDTETADQTAQWLLDAMSTKRTEFVERIRPNFAVDIALVETLGGVLPSATTDTHRLVFGYIASMRPVKEQVLAGLWARVIRRLSADSLDAEKMTAIVATADASEEQLQVILWALAQSHVKAARDSLLEAIGDGSNDALGAWPDIRSLPEEVAAKAITHLENHLEIRRQQASDGAITGWGYDQPRSLAILNSHHPSLAKWEPLIEYLEDRHVHAGEKTGALRCLGSLGRNLVPDQFHARLLTAAEAIAHTDVNKYDLPIGDLLATGAVGEATYLKACLSDEFSIGPDFLRLLSGDGRERSYATRIAAKRYSESSDSWGGILLGLANDADPEVRALAAAELISVTRRQTPLNDTIMAAIDILFAETGLVVPLSLTQQLVSQDELSEVNERLLGRLAEHQLPAVRRVAECRLRKDGA